MTDENFARFKERYEPLLECRRCGVIRVIDRVEDTEIWVNPNIDGERIYQGYHEIFDDYKIKGLCKRCDTNTRRDKWDGIERRTTNE